MGLTQPVLNLYTQHSTGVKCRSAKLNAGVMENVSHVHSAINLRVVLSDFTSPLLTAWSFNGATECE